MRKILAAAVLAILLISFSGRDNLPRLYADAAVTSGVEGEKLEKCLELMNVMAGAEVLTELSVRNGRPQYLLLARKTPHLRLAPQFPTYAWLGGDRGERSQPCHIHAVIYAET